MLPQFLLHCQTQKMITSLVSVRGLQILAKLSEPQANVGEHNKKRQKKKTKRRKKINVQRRDKCMIVQLIFTFQLIV